MSCYVSEYMQLGKYVQLRSVQLVPWGHGFTPVKQTIAVSVVDDVMSQNTTHRVSCSGIECH